MTMVPEKSTSHLQADGTALAYVWWQDDDFWIGYLEAFPDYWTQGTSRDDLEEHLRDLHVDLRSGELPRVGRRRAERAMALVRKIASYASSGGRKFTRDEMNER